MLTEEEEERKRNSTHPFFERMCKYLTVAGFHKGMLTPRTTFLWGT